MRVKLDENVPHDAVAVFTDGGHDVHTIPDEDLVGHPDADVWKVVRRDNVHEVVDLVAAHEAAQCRDLRLAVQQVRLDPRSRRHADQFRRAEAPMTSAGRLRVDTPAAT